MAECGTDLRVSDSQSGLHMARHMVNEALVCADASDTDRQSALRSFDIEVTAALAACRKAKDCDEMKLYM